MSGSLPQLQQHAQARSDEYCGRYATPRRRRKGRGAWSDDSVLKRQGSKVEKFYRRRDPEASLLYQVVREHFDELSLRSEA